MERKLTTPLAAAAALFVAAGGFVHLREWLEVYRDVPDSVSGSEVVTAGFPITAAASVLAVLALLGAALWRPAWLRIVAAATLAFQASAIGALIISREDSLFGWMEPTYNQAAEQALTVEIGAVLALGALLALDLVVRRSEHSEPVTA